MMLIVVYLPGPSGIRIRRFFYSYKFKSCGANLVVEVGVSIEGAEFVSVGNNVFIDKYCLISAGDQLQGRIFEKTNDGFSGRRGEIVLGNDIHLCQYCILSGYGGIDVADNTVLSAGCKVYSLTNLSCIPGDSESIVSIQPYNQAPFLLSPVVFNKNCWLGLNVIVMPGVDIGANSFVVSNSLLLDVFPDNSYVSGQPAKVIRKRFG